jgi:uncharacterized protein GlcG (DUF336 family)
MPPALFAAAVTAALLAPACSRRADSPGNTVPGAAGTPAARDDKGCDALPKPDELRRLLVDAAAAGNAGGLAGGKFEWASVVNRRGETCAVVVSTDDAEAPWPGSQSISVAKAYTANAFSTDTNPLSTARLYTLAQPGHSLFGAAAANPFDPRCLESPPDHGKQKGKICGGTIVFGGGLPLYRGTKLVGGLGASGDTACADHEIAKRMRDKAGMNPPKGAAADEIVYASVDGPSVFAHPLCINTWRNGKKLGEEPPGDGSK